jgi:hypothetical protein
MSIARCERRYCGMDLVERHDRHLGRVALVCLGCERKAAGLCRDCPAAVRDCALRCKPCAKRHARERDRDAHRLAYRDPVTREKKLAARRRQRSTPEQKAAHASWQRAYRARQPKQPPSDLDRLYKRHWERTRYANDPAYREKMKRKARERAARAATRFAAPIAPVQFSVADEARRAS